MAQPPGDTEQRISTLVAGLPPMDETVDAILRAATEGHVDPRDLKEAVSRDSAMCAGLLALANASCYGPRDRPVESVDEALERVGIQALAQLAGTACAFEAVREKVRKPALWAQYVDHSHEIAQSARVLAGVMGLSAKEQECAAVAGLTHDVGRIVIMAAAGDVPASLVGTRPDEMLTVLEDEERAWGLDHCRLGFALFRRWGFSPAMQEGILRHHSPLVGEDFSFSGALVFTAHFISMSDFTGDILARMLKPPLLERLRLTAADLSAAQARFASLRAG